MHAITKHCHSRLSPIYQIVTSNFWFPSCLCSLVFVLSTFSLNFIARPGLLCRTRLRQVLAGFPHTQTAHIYIETPQGGHRVCARPVRGRELYLLPRPIQPLVDRAKYIQRYSTVHRAETYLRVEHLCALFSFHDELAVYLLSMYFFHGIR